MIRPSAIIVAVLIFAPLPALADFLITGPVKATTCHGFGIQSCSTAEVNAVKGSDGRAYEIKQRISSVTEFNESKGRCSVDFSNRGRSNVLSKLSSASSTPVFLQAQGGGQFVEIQPDYITFQCRKE